MINYLIFTFMHSILNLTQYCVYVITAEKIHINFLSFDFEGNEDTTIFNHNT